MESISNGAAFELKRILMEAAREQAAIIKKMKCCPECGLPDDCHEEWCSIGRCWRKVQAQENAEAISRNLIEAMSRRLIFSVDKAIEDALRKRREAARFGSEKAAAIYSDFIDSLNTIKTSLWSQANKKNG